MKLTPKSSLDAYRKVQIGSLVIGDFFIDAFHDIDKIMSGQITDFSVYMVTSSKILNGEIIAVNIGKKRNKTFHQGSQCHPVNIDVAFCKRVM